MNREELNKKIKELEYYINREELKKSGNIMFMIVTLLTILGGGFALGILFNSLAKIMMLAIGIGAFANVGTIKQLMDANDEIKRCHEQIDEYHEQLNRNHLNSNNEIKKEVKNNYSYNREKERIKKEVKIETFTEEDFYEESNNKRR